MLPISLLILSLSLLCFAETTLKSHRSVVIWHGMGDDHASEGMLTVKSIIEQTHPGIYVQLIHLAETPDQDRNAGYFGNVNEQVDLVCNQLASNTNLTSTVDAIGFSQGGQFLRAYVQRCNFPRVHNLITFGSQHFGVAHLPGCEANDVLCALMRNIARFGVYSDYVQRRLVQAQYFNDPHNQDAYLEKNIFLPDVNNEILLNNTYKENLSSLNKFVLIMFSEDETVVPRETAWFSWYEDATSSDKMLSMHNLPIYTEDRIGLRTLDDRGAIDFLVAEGKHMQISEEYVAAIAVKYLGTTERTTVNRPSFVVQQ